MAFLSIKSLVTLNVPLTVVCVCTLSQVQKYSGSPLQTEVDGCVSWVDPYRNLRGAYELMHYSFWSTLCAPTLWRPQRNSKGLNDVCCCRYVVSMKQRSADGTLPDDFITLSWYNFRRSRRGPDAY